ncbi:MAG: ribbon-helix-helix domain-containing protein [Kiritimatiellia bacterium]
MSNITVNISFHDSLLREIDRVARDEARSRSEFMREAARLYIQRKKRWADIFVMGRKISVEKKLGRADVSAEIAAYRKSKAAER